MPVEFNPQDPTLYQFWKDGLLKRKNNVEIQVPVDKPQAGFYEYRPHPGTPYQPVAIWWKKDGTMQCRLAGQPIDPLKVWNFCAARPIAEEAYKVTIAIKRDDPAPIGDNRPPADDFASFDLQAQSLLEKARNWIKGLDSKPVGTQAQADAAAVLVNDLRKIKGDGDKRRLELTKPHRDAEAEINGQWNPHIKAMDTAIKTLLARVQIYLNAQKAKMAEVEAETGMKVEAPKAGAGVARRAITTREVHVIEVIDPEAAAKHYCNTPEVLAVVQDLATAEYKATNKEPPGCKGRIEEIAR